jgi:hypothetical protein
MTTGSGNPARNCPGWRDSRAGGNRCTPGAPITTQVAPRHSSQADPAPAESPDSQDAGSAPDQSSMHVHRGLVDHAMRLPVCGGMLEIGVTACRTLMQVHRRLVEEGDGFRGPMTFRCFADRRLAPTNSGCTCIENWFAGAPGQLGQLPVIKAHVLVDVKRAKARCASAQAGAIPVVEHPVQPFGSVANLNQDLIGKGRVLNLPVRAWGVA